MRTDDEIKRDLEGALKLNAGSEVMDISVQVYNGVVTLTGQVINIAQKHQAARVARFCTGVRAIANDIVVGPDDDASGKTDPKIAQKIIAGLKFWFPNDWERIRPTVRNGHVMLEGTVEWHHQRDRAESVARRVKGVASVGNCVRVTPLVAVDDVKLKIEQAFRRSAEIDASRVAINADGSEVTIRGKVRTWTEREQAQRCAWSIPGVTEVTNNLRVKP